ncbi:MAG: FKBP-type peptidyl-prolyl cis-trans isomerase [Actinomycetes bacterium]
MAKLAGIKIRGAQTGTILALSTLAILATGALSACTTDGGTKLPNTSSSSTSHSTKEKTITDSNAEYVSVTGSLGSAPVIGTPKGNPPETLVSKDLHVGTGSVVAPNSTLTVNYTLVAWSTGKIVDSSWSNGTSGKPATFPLANVIPGWQQGLPGMKAGGRRLLIIPPTLGYGANGAGPIAPNETLIFVVDLIDVK